MTQNEELNQIEIVHKILRDRKGHEVLDLCPCELACLYTELESKLEEY